MATAIDKDYIDRLVEGLRGEVCQGGMTMGEILDRTEFERVGVLLYHATNGRDYHLIVSSRPLANSWQRMCDEIPCWKFKSAEVGVRDYARDFVWGPDTVDPILPQEDVEARIDSGAWGTFSESTGNARKPRKSRKSSKSGKSRKRKSRSMDDEPSYSLIYSASESDEPYVPTTEQYPTVQAGPVSDELFTDRRSEELHARGYVRFRSVDGTIWQFYMRRVGKRCECFAEFEGEDASQCLRDNNCDRCIEEGRPLDEWAIRYSFGWDDAKVVLMRVKQFVNTQIGIWQARRPLESKELSA
jgi:hypothetical protein